MYEQVFCELICDFPSSNSTQCRMLPARGLSRPVNFKYYNFYKTLLHKMPLVYMISVGKSSCCT